MISISVIIPTKNRSSLLDRTLQSILVQTFPVNNFEVIVVDNDSQDNTLETCEKYRNKANNIIYTLEKEPGLHAARHTGLKLANGQILAYVDDDIEAFPGWLMAIHEAFKDQDVGLVGGKAVPIYESTPPMWLEGLWEETADGKFLPHLSLIDFGDRIKEVNPEFIFGCNFSIRKHLLATIGGFHPDGMPDSLLRYRGDGETFPARQVKSLGYKTIYNYKASVKHWVSASRMTREYLKKRVFMFGIGSSFSTTRENNGIRKSSMQRSIDLLRRFKRLTMATGLKKELLRSFYDGYDFHQSEMEKDSELRAWVLKENYLSDDLKAHLNSSYKNPG